VADSLRKSSDGVSNFALRFQAHLLAMVVPLVAMQLYDRVLDSRNLATLHALMMGLVVAVVLEGLCQWVTRTTQLSAASRAYVAERQRWLRAVVHYPLSKVNNELVEGWRDADAVLRQRLNQHERTSVPLMTADALVLAVMTAYLAWLSPALALATLALYGAYAVWFLLRTRAVRAMQHAGDEYSRARRESLVELTLAAPTVKAMALEDKALENIMMRTHNPRHGRRLWWAAIDSRMLAHVQVLMVALMGVYPVLHNQISVGTLIACVLIAGRMVMPWQSLLASFGSLSQLRHQTLRLGNTLKQLESAAQSTQPPVPNPVKQPWLTIHADSTNAEPLIYLQPGTMLALMGEQTVTSLCAQALIGRLPWPEKDWGQCVSSLSEASPIHVASILPGEGVFYATVRENLTGFRHELQERAMEIADYLGLGRTIGHLPQGLDTRLNHALCQQLPHGFTQKMALVRVLASRPDVVLIDHPDMALDEDGYNHFYQLLAGLHNGKHGADQWRPAVILTTEDRNLAALADQKLLVEEHRISVMPSERGASIVPIRPMFSQAGGAVWQ
jgi:ABC-type bacteriocin/lantibiotic exporter with double-glycine peptidase domain